MSQRSQSKSTFARQADRTARTERAIQSHIDRIDAKKPAKKQSGAAMQAGQRAYPSSFPKQHLKKPGHEADLKLAPMFEAPDYKGSEKLKGCVALITGADSGIGRAVAVLYAREGADVVVAYLNEHDDAKATRQAVEAEGRRCIVVAGDVADPKFCEAAVKQTIKTFGKIDILVNNAAFQEHVQKFEDLTEEHSIAPSRPTCTAISIWRRRPFRICGRAAPS
jgi:short subunit dehydrogenase